MRALEQNKQKIWQGIRKRVWFTRAFMFAVLAVIVLRYGWIQVVQGGRYSEMMRAQISENYAMQSPRGPILDRNGRELAVSTLTKSLFIDPSHTDHPEELAADLSPLIGVSEEDILEAYNHGGGFVWLKRFLPHEEYEAVRQLMKEKHYTDSLGFVDESKRFYPNDDLAANVIGFVGTDDKGLDGVEQAADALLKGDTQKDLLYTDAGDRPILDSVFKRRPYAGERCKTVELTIDSAIQFIVEQELDRAMAENHPKGVTCIVMDPKTGEILAMASRPSYNPNRFQDYNDESWKNRAVSTIYEPGSTFKSCVAAAALQEKVMTPNQIIVDPGYVMVSGRRIQNADGEALGAVTFTDVVKHSLNTGFAQVGLRLGADRLTKYAKDFGFGKPTGVELPGEEQGLLFDPKNMRDSDIATMSIGQSIAVTPLQLVTAISSIANDGMLLKPHIIKSVKNADGSLYHETQKEEVRQVIDPATAKTLVGMLEEVVSSGSGKKAQVKGYRIAGKTGTAQKIRPDGTGYMEGHYIASFCGFAPVEDPRITVLVLVDDPGAGAYYGGLVAAPVVQRIFTQLFRYLEIAPSSDPFAGMEKKQRQKPRDVKPAAKPATKEGQTLVPDFTGLSIRAAAEKAAAAGLSFESAGSGAAVGQSIPPNTVVARGSSVTVNFQP